jgi:hypothetical protein
VPNGEPEKTIGLDGKSYPEGAPKIRIPNNWAPRNYQMNVWRYLERGGKRAICVWHRRAGKDDVCLHWAAASMIDKPATYWHMLPAFSQGRKAIWTAVNPHMIENDGWALFITTARGRNHAKSMLDMAQTREDWFSEVLPVNVTNAMSEEAVFQLLRLRDGNA